MKILGFSGSSRKNDVSGVYKIVETVFENTGIAYDLISLRGKKIGGCIACLGCVKDNMCKINDDMTALREKIVEADALVIGSPNYYSNVNAITHALLERWFQFRHRGNDDLWGKLVVAVGVGGGEGLSPANVIEQICNYNLIETVAKVTGQGAASCYSCGYGETCSVSIPVMQYGKEVKITEDMIPDVCKQAEVMKLAANAGKNLNERLNSGHDPKIVAQNVQKKLMEQMAA